jgi:toxin ParE1/3/4
VGKVAVVITESALADLEDIENYISLDSPAIARKFISSIFDKIDQLHTYPESGKYVPEIKDSSIRELLINKYRIVYQFDANSKVNILRVVHGSRLLDIEF